MDIFKILGWDYPRYETECDWALQCLRFIWEVDLRAIQSWAWLEQENNGFCGTVNY